MRAGSIARLDRVEQAAQDIGSPSAHRTYHLPWGCREQLSFDVRDGLADKPKGTPVTGGKLVGDQISFEAGGARYEGKVSGNTIQGTVRTSTTTPFTARR